MRRPLCTPANEANNCNKNYIPMHSMFMWQCKCNRIMFAINNASMLTVNIQHLNYNLSLTLILSAFVA